MEALHLWKYFLVFHIISSRPPQCSAWALVPSRGSIHIKQQSSIIVSLGYRGTDTWVPILILPELNSGTDNEGSHYCFWRTLICWRYKMSWDFRCLSIKWHLAFYVASFSSRLLIRNSFSSQLLDIVRLKIDIISGSCFTKLFLTWEGYPPSTDL